MRKLLFVILFLVSPSIAFPQPIEFKLSFWKGGSYYIQEGKTYGMGWYGRNVKKIISSSPEAIREVNKYYTYQTIAYALGFSGAFMINYALFDHEHLGSSEEYGLIIGGVGLIGINVGLGYMGFSHLKKAAEMYNSSLKARETSAKQDPKTVRVALGYNEDYYGITLSYNF
ncbi:MAG TPA: hypothetical protein VGB16_06640 [candidate division Zixibacteria bacterium]